MFSKRSALLSLILITLSLGGTIAFAQVYEEAKSAFRSYVDIQDISIKVPTVVELNMDDLFIERSDFAVVSKTEEKYVPFLFQKRSTTQSTPFTIDVSNAYGNIQNLTDEDKDTYVDFDLPVDKEGTASFTIEGDTPITASSITLLLDYHVALPNTVMVTAVRNGQEVILVNTKKMTSQTVIFPETSSSQWKITFTYGQPLRVLELRFNEKQAQKATTQRLRFLAQPDNDYRVYIDPDINVKVPAPESGNLSIDKGVLQLPSFTLVDNPQYSQADIDLDGIPDVSDNCTNVANADQEDIDGNNRGDVCDDFDRDGVINSKDNCPNEPNERQLDTDGDEVGDACDDEESRLTEKYKWIPWAGIGTALIVLLSLLFISTKPMRESKGKASSSEEEPPVA
jgi:hypothetical protein